MLSPLSPTVTTTSNMCEIDHMHQNSLRTMNTGGRTEAARASRWSPAAAKGVQHQSMRLAASQKMGYSIPTTAPPGCAHRRCEDIQGVAVERRVRLPARASSPQLRIQGLGQKLQRFTCSASACRSVSRHKDPRCQQMLFRKRTLQRHIESRMRVSLPKKNKNCLRTVGEKTPMFQHAQNKAETHRTHQTKHIRIAETYQKQRQKRITDTKKCRSTSKNENLLTR